VFLLLMKKILSMSPSTLRNIHTSSTSGADYDPSPSPPHAPPVHGGVLSPHRFKCPSLVETTGREDEEGLHGGCNEDMLRRFGAEVATWSDEDNDDNDDDEYTSGDDDNNDADEYTSDDDDDNDVVDDDGGGDGGGGWVQWVAEGYCEIDDDFDYGDEQVSAHSGGSGSGVAGRRWRCGYRLRTDSQAERSSNGDCGTDEMLLAAGVEKLLLDIPTGQQQPSNTGQTTADSVPSPAPSETQWGVATILSRDPPSAPLTCEGVVAGSDNNKYESSRTSKKVKKKKRMGVKRGAPSRGWRKLYEEQASTSDDAHAAAIRKRGETATEKTIFSTTQAALSVFQCHDICKSICSFL
jgi:hypothetical protein